MLKPNVNLDGSGKGLSSGGVRYEHANNSSGVADKASAHAHQAKHAAELHGEHTMTEVRAGAADLRGLGCRGYKRNPGSIGCQFCSRLKTEHKKGVPKMSEEIDMETQRRDYKREQVR